MASYAAATAIIGFMVVGSANDIIQFFYNSLKVVDGYTVSTAKDGPSWQVYLALMGWTVYVTLMAHAVLKTDTSFIKYFALAAALMFASFKLGFVRHDNHVRIFFFVWGIIFTIYYIIISSRIESFLKNVIFIFSFLMFIVLLGTFSFSMNSITIDFLSDKVQQVNIAYHVITDERWMDSQTAKGKRLYRNYTLQSETSKMLKDKTVDFFPWDISIAECYGLRWQPRPAFQSYAVFNDYLDSMNAEHFSAKNAPDFLLYSLKSIDNRYHLFDEPATFRTLMTNYQPVSIDGEFLVLQSNKSYKQPQEHAIQTIAVKMGERITIPKNIDGYLFARISIDYTLWWNIAKLLYKPPHVYIQFVVNNTVTQPYRFIPSTAKNGIFISEFIKTPDELADVWNGKLDKNMDAMFIAVQNPWCFERFITVEFFEIRKNRYNS
jgi:hypothetical protein